MVEQMIREKIDVKLTCCALFLIRSGFHAWRKRPMAEREIESAKLIVEIKKIHDESRGIYGLPRIHAALKNAGKKHGRGRVRRLMKNLGICVVFKKSFTIKTTNSEHDGPIAARILKIKDVTTHPVKPNQVWVTDITYSHTGEGVCYDNAFAETFFGMLKNELVYRTHSKTRQKARNAIFERIEVFYSRKRIYSSLGCLRLMSCEEAQLAA